MMPNDPGATNEPLSAELDDLLSAERARPNPTGATAHRVEARLARTLGWGSGGGPGAGGGLVASRAIMYVLAALLSIATVAGVIELRRRSSERERAVAPVASAPAATAVAAVAAAPSFAPLRLVSGTAENDPTRESGSFEGSVRSSATGRPIAHAQLVFSRDGQTVSTLSRDDGSFVFDAPEPGRYALAHASAEGHIDYAPVWGESGVELVARPGTRLKGATIYLSPAVEYAGVVRGPKHEPVAGATVRFASTSSRERDETVRRADHVVTDARGEFRLVLDVDDTLVATHPDLGRGEAQVHLAETTTHRIVVQLDGKRSLDGVPDASPPVARFGHDGAGTLRGTVRDSSTGLPLAAFSVVVWSRIGSVQRRTAAVGSFFDASGEYELRGLAPGDYVVTAISDGFAPSVEVNVSIGAEGSAGAPRDFRLEHGARVSGVVVDDGTKRPIAGAQVALEGALGAEQAPVRLTASAVTDAAGRFEIAGLAAGLRSITVTAPHHHGRVLSGLEADAKKDLEPMRVELVRTKEGEEPRLELTGIGAVLTSSEDVLVVKQVLDKGGASEMGLTPGDAIVAIDGASPGELGFEQAIQRIRGPEGSAVVLKLRRAAGGAVEDVRVPRRRVRVQ